MTNLQAPDPITSRSNIDFVEFGVVEAVVPAATNVDLQDLFEAWDGDIPEDSTSMVPFIDQRQFLLLDELVTAYVVLRTPALGEYELKKYLSRLAITIEARAVGPQAPKPGDPPSAPSHGRDVTETLASESVNISDDPLICATEIQLESPEGEAEPVQYIYMFWKVIIPLGRPRARFPNLSIFLNPIASLRPPQSLNKPDKDAEYLPSNVPASINLLGSFCSDPFLEGLNPHLSASKLSKAIPSTPVTKQHARPIKTGARRLFRAAPAFLWRIRFLRFPGLSEKNAILACFDIEITQFAGCDVSLDKISLQLSSGSTEAVSVDLPHRCRPAEQFTYVYKLVSPLSLDGPADVVLSSRTLTVSLTATALVSPECTPKVKLKWKTALELPPSRPTSISGALATTPIEPPSSVVHDALVMTGEVAEIQPAPFISPGISLTISAPQRIYVKETFNWEVMIVNRSDKMQRFALVPVPKRKFADLYGSGNRPNSSGPLGDRSKNWLVNPVVDDNVLYSVQKSDALEATELVCLTPDVRIGSLGPASCYVAQLKFLPLSEGVLYLEALRLVDLTTQHSVDIPQLPDMVSMRRES